MLLALGGRSCVWAGVELVTGSQLSPRPQKPWRAEWATQVSSLTQQVPRVLRSQAALDRGSVKGQGRAALGSAGEPILARLSSPWTGGGSCQLLSPESQLPLLVPTLGAVVLSRVSVTSWRVASGHEGCNKLVLGTPLF